MSDFIEREPVAIFVEECGCSPKWIAKRIRNQKAFPAAEVEPVVYCKDCVYLGRSDFYGECSRGLLGVVGPMDYCSRGARRNKEDKHETD